VSGYFDGSENLHPYECWGKGRCRHCDRRRTDKHDPATCELCDPEYDYQPNPYRDEKDAA